VAASVAAAVAMSGAETQRRIQQCSRSGHLNNLQPPNCGLLSDTTRWREHHQRQLKEKPKKIKTKIRIENSLL